MEIDDGFTCDFCGYTVPIARVQEERKNLSIELSEQIRRIQAERMERALNE